MWLHSKMWDAERLAHASNGCGVSSTVHILVHLLRHLLHVTKVCRGDSHLHHNDNVVDLDGLQSAVIVHVAHLICDDGRDHIINLFHVQRTDGSDVTDARFTDHRLGKLYLSCDVGNLYRVVVVVGDVESVRDVEIHAALFLVIADENGLHPNIGHINGAREEEEHSQTGQ